MGDSIGDDYRGYEGGNTRSLDYSSNKFPFLSMVPCSDSAD